MPLTVPSALKRAWSRLLQSVGPGRLELVFAPGPQLGLGNVPIDPQRAEFVLSFLFSEGLVGRKSSHLPPTASFRELLRVHEDNYLDTLHQPESLISVLGYEPTPDIHEKLLEAQRVAVGGTIKAARLALDQRKSVFHLGGGLHHARPNRGAGFCVFNDVAVAIAVARADGFEGQVLVVDLDLHDGDGTRAAFAQDESVFTFSIHNRDWDDAPAVANLSIELAGDVEDSEYLRVLSENLPTLLDQVQPELVFFVAGVDPAFDDRLGNWKISPEGMLSRDRLVFDQVESRCPDTPIVSVTAGGYGNRAWQYTARTLAWLLGGLEDPVLPSREELALARYRRLLDFGKRPEGATGSVLSSPTKATAGPLPNNWGLSEEDILGDLGTAPSRPPRLLGYFSPHAIELILERSGLLERLREVGFEHPTLALDLDPSGQQTVQVFTDPAHTRRLLEIRLSRDRHTVPGMNLMVLEWLLLQNPRGNFAAHRPPLPGQKHPGLGLLNEVMALLVLLGEQLHMDGILFVPSHYHLAAKGKKFLRFLDPNDEAWFRAVRRAIGDLELGQATIAVDAQKVLDKDGDSVTWRPMPMVIPISRQLREVVVSDDYEQAVARERPKHEFKLAG